MASICGVSVQTWGTNNRTSNGILEFIDARLFGGNVGHAALTLVFPANADGNNMIKEYCYDAQHNIILPFKKKNVQLADGSREEVYEVRFSWWPSTSNTGHALVSDINQDRLTERVGADFAWSPEAIEYFNPENRIYKGLLGESTKSLGPLSTLHFRNLDSDARELLKLRAELLRITEKINSAKTFIKKISKSLDKNVNIKLNDSEVLLIKNIFPGDDSSHLKKGTALLTSESSILKQKAEEKIELLNKEAAVLNSKLSKNTTLLPEQNAAHKAALENEILLLQDKHKQMYQKLSKLYINYQSISTIDKQQDQFLYAEFITNLDNSLIDWQNQVTNSEKITSEDIQKITNLMISNLEDIIKEINNKKIELSYINNQTHEQFVTYGTVEDSSTFIPIKTFPNSKVGISNGLDVVAMLKQMKLLVSDNKGFNLYKKNCSETIGKILEAGVEQPHLKAIAANRAWGVFGNPQVIRNAVLSIQHGIIHQERTTIWSRITNFSPLQQTTGALLKNLIDQDASIAKKTFSATAMLLVSPLMLSSTLIGGIFNPLPLYSTCLNVISYAYTKKSNSFKIATTLALGPIALAYMLPAALQMGVSSFVIKPLTTAIEKTPPHTPLAEEKPQNTKQELHAQMSTQINNLIKDIDSKDPEEAICIFLDELRSSNNIPVFSATVSNKIFGLAKTNNLLPEKIKDYIQQLPQEFKEQYSLNEIGTIKGIIDILCTISLERINAIRFKENLKPEQPTKTSADTKKLPTKKSMLFNLEPEQAQKPVSQLHNPTPTQDKPNI